MKILAERNRNVQNEIIKQNNLKPQKYATSSVVQPFGGGNTLVSVDVANDVFQYLLYLEKQNVLRYKFLDGIDSQINGRMRQILVDWLFHVQRRFDLLNETLSLAVWILDRSLLKMNVTKDKLQLLGVSCIFIAAKYEEIMVPNIQDFVYVSADHFLKKDVLAMEQNILKLNDFYCNITHSIQFLRRFRHCLKAPKPVYSLAKFICDVGMISYSLAHHLPSVTASVAMYIASYVLEFPISSRIACSVLSTDLETLNEIAQSFIPYIIQFADSEWKLYSLREKHMKEVALPFDEAQLKRFKNLARGAH